MMEVVCNNCLGFRSMLNVTRMTPLETLRDLKKLIAAQAVTRCKKIILKKWYMIFKDHTTLGDHEIHDGMNLELYSQWIRILIFLLLHCPLSSSHPHPQHWYRCLFLKTHPRLRCGKYICTYVPICTYTYYMYIYI
uniref:Ubiquitin-like protein 5 n=1 Tax=Theropithecus gelada TaxID=9565 RepID=A0A8D2GCZ0_THEGE